MLASNPGIRYKDVASKLGVSATTITNWMCSPDVVDRVYKRYMELAGNELPAVVQAVIEEAKLGNVHAARLVLEHFGKLENKIKVQVESNFEKFMKGDDTEDAEFFEVTENQEQVLETLTDDNIKLPEKLKIDFNEPEYPKTMQDQVLWDNHRLQNNLITQAKLMVEYNDDLSLKEAEKILAENKENNGTVVEEPEETNEVVVDEA